MLHKYKKLGAIFLIVVGAMLVAYFLLNFSNPDEETVIVHVGDDTLTLLEARTSEEHVQGLSGRISLTEYDGMLFIFETERKDVTFWMNDMLIDLDIVWVADDTIVQIDRDVVHPEGNENPEVRSSSAGILINSVIEVETTRADTWRVGDPVSLGY